MTLPIQRLAMHYDSIKRQLVHVSRYRMADKHRGDTEGFFKWKESNNSGEKASQLSILFRNT